MKLESKPNKKKIRITKYLNKFILYRLADLAERLGFKSEKINNLKTRYFNYINRRLPSR